MAKKKRRAALKSFARKGSSAYPQKYRTDKELVYGGGKNYKIPEDFANVAAGASTANLAGYEFIYLNRTLYGTAGMGRLATRTSADGAGGDTLDLTIQN